MISHGARAMIIRALELRGAALNDHEVDALYEHFVEQSLEEAKHYDALRRVIPKITGRPLEPPPLSVRTNAAGITPGTSRSTTASSPA